LLSELQPRLELAACPGCSSAAPTFDYSGERSVRLVFAGWYTLDITVPLYHCSCCTQLFHVPAAAVGFFPSTAKMADRLYHAGPGLKLVWFERDFLAQLYAMQHCSPQLATKACTEAMAVVHGGVNVPAPRLEALLGPCMDRYRAFDFRMRRADTVGCDDYPPEQGLLGVCGARCHLAGTVQADGTVRPLPDLCLDACMGLRRYAGAA
jgi:hypothetical protein